MTKEEIKEIVELTVKAIKREGMTKDFKEIIYRETSGMLREHFNNQYSEKVARAMDELKTDPYYMIIPMYYGKRMTHEQIAEKLAVEVSTITRNKKRLCAEIYARL